MKKFSFVRLVLSEIYTQSNQPDLAFTPTEPVQNPGDALSLFAGDPGDKLGVPLGSGN
jgi:hypothetical protein